MEIQGIHESLSTSPKPACCCTPYNQRYFGQYVAQQGSCKIRPNYFKGWPCNGAVPPIPSLNPATVKHRIVTSRVKQGSSHMRSRDSATARIANIGLYRAAGKALNTAIRNWEIGEAGCQLVTVLRTAVVIGYLLYRYSSRAREAASE